RRDGVGELELVVQEPLVGLDVARLVHDLGRGVELRVDARDLLDDLRRADERPLLAVQELRELPRLEMAACIRLLPRREPAPHVRAGGGGRLVREALRVLGVEVLRPVDPTVRVPLQVLPLLVEAEERIARLLVFPAEDGAEGGRDLPGGLRSRARIPLRRAHGVALRPPPRPVPASLSTWGAQFAAPLDFARRVRILAPRVRP